MLRRLRRTSATYYEIVNHKANKCLSLANGGSTANNTQVVQWEYYETTDAVWKRTATIIDG